MDPNSKYIKANINISNKIIQPFYEPPVHCQKTSAEIIKEARVAIKDTTKMGDTFQASVKPINTQRPFTPRDKQRILFGKKAKTSRPPSSFSLRYLQFENSEIVSPPSTTTSATRIEERSASRVSRSNSIPEISNEKIFNLNVKDLLTHKIKLPSLEGSVKSRKKLFPTSSLCYLPEEESNSTEIKRNAFSSPKERTDFDNATDPSPFGHSSSQKLRSESLILGPQNLEKIFENKQIIQDSEKLFIKKNHWTASKNQKVPVQPQNSVEIDPFESKIEVILNSLNSTSSKQEKGVLKILDELYDCLDKSKLFGTKISSKLKIQILKSLYKQVESSNEELLLRIAQIILTLKVTGNNLSGVCKLVFKVSRNDKNDNLFLPGNILELFVDALGRSSPLDDAEACIYGYGAIKFLTMNATLLDKILNLGILQLMVLHMKLVNAAKREKSSIPEPTNHVLYQLTGALRNLASEETMYDNFVNCGVITELCQLLELFHSDIDVVSNITRNLSIISTSDSCCMAIAQYKNIYKTFVLLFNKYPGKEKIIVRLAYMMGNLVAKLDQSRIDFYHETNSIECLVDVLNIYLQKYLNIGIKKEENSNEDNPTDVKDSSADVIVKVVRIIANAAINPEIGVLLIDTHGINLIEIFLMILFTKSVTDNKELILSVLSTLNNLSYYYTSGNEEDAFHIKQIDLAKALCNYITCENKECLIESIRVLGNLSRSKTTRDYITKCGSFRTLFNVLCKDDIDMLHTTMGVFVNLMADFQTRIIFKEHDGIFKLIRILQIYGELDWSLSMLTCQVIWNYCIDSSNLHEVFEGTEIEELLCILAEYLDEEKLFGITDSQENLEVFASQEYMLWDEFANVATNLLEKIESFLDNIEPLEITSYSDEEDLCIPQDNQKISFTKW